MEGLGYETARFMSPRHLRRETYCISVADCSFWLIIACTFKKILLKFAVSCGSFV
jgi:hypothetical protein